jgi:hypothetical protein
MTRMSPDKPMNAPMEGCSDNPAEVLSRLRSKGVDLWTQQGQLRFKGPKGALTDADREQLRVTKSQLIAFLAHDTSPNRIAALVARDPGELVPLAFSQAYRWQILALGDGSSLRTLACSSRWTGPLDLGLLRATLSQILARHEALRTRMRLVDGVPRQEIHTSLELDLQVSDHTQLSVDPSDIDLAAVAFHEQTINVLSDPLCAVRLLRLGAQDHILLLALDHLIADAISLQQIMLELGQLYRASFAGGDSGLPEIPIQLADYAVWQERSRPAWLTACGSFWNERLAVCDRTRFPRERGDHSGSPGGWAMVPIKIDPGTTAELRQWCRTRGATLPLVVLAAYASVVARWCGSDEIAIQYQTAGRRPPIENAVGYFASMLCLRVDVRHATLQDVVRRVIQEYCEVLEREDVSYMATQRSHDRFVRSTLFNWVTTQPTEGDPEPLAVTDHLKVQQICVAGAGLDRLLADHDPEIILSDRSQQITGGLYFPKAHFSVASMERFSRNFAAFVRALLIHPERPLHSLPFH